MYVLDTEIDVNWTLYSKIAPPLLEDLSVVMYNPGCVTPVPFDILSTNYIKPTADTMGIITHKFTPAVTGLWQVSLLVSGTIVSTQDIYVIELETSITKSVSTDCLP